MGNKRKTYGVPQYRPKGIDDGELTRGSGITHVETFNGCSSEEQSDWFLAATDVLYGAEIPHYCIAKGNTLTIEFADIEGLAAFKEMRQNALPKKLAKHAPELEISPVAAVG